MRKELPVNRKTHTRITAIVLFLTICLSSCALMDQLGFDTYDYMSEPVVRSHTADSETAETLLPMLNVLITDSVVLPEFEHTSDAIDLYRDAVLRYMLKNGYAKYSGNIDLIRNAEKEYPEYQITQIIPAAEFEAKMYEYFGGNVKISHRNGSIFQYLKNVNAYICPVIPEDRNVVPKIISVEETQKTYRVHFTCISGEDVSDVYFALIIKREDGTYYFKKLLKEA